MDCTKDEFVIDADLSLLWRDVYNSSTCEAEAEGSKAPGNLGLWGGVGL